MQCDQVQELADVSALGALDEEERRAVDSHVSGCAFCRRMLQEAQEFVSRLALAAPLQHAPAALHAGILREIRRDAARSPTVANPVRPRRQSWRWRAALAASLAALFVLGASGWAYEVQSKIDRLQQKNRVLEQGMSDVESQRTTLFLLASSNSATQRMQPTSLAANAEGTVIWNAAHKQCSILADNLPPAPAGESYHVWLVNSKHTWDSGELTPGQQGMAQKTVDLAVLPEQQGYDVVVMLQPRQSTSSERRPVLQTHIGAP